MNSPNANSPNAQAQGAAGSEECRPCTCQIWEIIFRRFRPRGILKVAFAMLTRSNNFANCLLAISLGSRENARSRANLNYFRSRHLQQQPRQTQYFTGSNYESTLPAWGQNLKVRYAGIRLTEAPILWYDQAVQRYIKTAARGRNQ